MWPESNESGDVRNVHEYVIRDDTREVFPLNVKKSLLMQEKTLFSDIWLTSTEKHYHFKILKNVVIYFFE